MVDGAARLYYITSWHGTMDLVRRKMMLVGRFQCGSLDGKNREREASFTAFPVR